jgi:hypothetical protein
MDQHQRKKTKPSKKRKAKTTKILNEKNWDPPEWQPWIGLAGRPLPPTAKFANEIKQHGHSKPLGAQIRKRFKFHTTELQKEIQNLQLTRKRSAIEIAHKKWEEAKTADNETFETKKLEAIKAHEEATAATVESQQNACTILTWDELANNTPRKITSDFNKNKYLVKTWGYLNYLHEDPFGWGHSPQYPLPKHNEEPPRKKTKIENRIWTCYHTNTPLRHFPPARNKHAQPCCACGSHAPLPHPFTRFSHQEWICPSCEAQVPIPEPTCWNCELTPTIAKTTPDAIHNKPPEPLPTQTINKLITLIQKHRKPPKNQTPPLTAKITHKPEPSPLEKAIANHAIAMLTPLPTDQQPNEETPHPRYCGPTLPHTTLPRHTKLQAFIAGAFPTMAPETIEHAISSLFLNSRLPENKIRSEINNYLRNTPLAPRQDPTQHTTPPLPSTTPPPPQAQPSADWRPNPDFLSPRFPTAAAATAAAATAAASPNNNTDARPPKTDTLAHQQWVKNCEAAELEASMKPAPPITTTSTPPTTKWPAPATNQRNTRPNRCRTCLAAGLISDARPNTEFCRHHTLPHLR